MSPYKRPRAQSPHGPHGIFYSPPDHHRFMAGGAHYSPNIYAAAPQRDVRQHIQEIPTLNYPDHHSRDVSPFGSLQSQIRRRPSLLSEFHGGAAERERERSKEFFSRNIDQSYRLHTSNHHPENDVIAAKRRRLDNDTKFRPVHENNTASSRVVTSSANHPEVKKEPFIPKVENVSPTPCDDELPSSSSKVSKEGLLQSMEKMDRDIQMVDNQIANLKKKKQELEQRAAQPREEEKAVADEDWEPKQENTVQLIYAENLRKADTAHKEVAKCAGQNVLPLYNQLSDIKNHQEIMKKNYELSRRFILYFKKQAVERSFREKSFCQLYHKRMEAWENRMEKIEADPRKKAKDAKTREFFEKQFPEIRKQREQHERFSSRAGTRSWGNIARSDAELAEIVDGLNEQEANERHMRSLTVIPPILFEKEERNVNFINKNGLVEDAMQEYKDRQRMNIWTDEEREIFREKFMQHPKNFGAIAQFLERKSVADCVLYYYQNKKRENYKQRKQHVRRKKTLPQKSTNITVNRNYDDEDKDDKEDGTSQDPERKDRGDSKDGLNGGSSQNGDASNGPPMSVPTNCALCHHSLDAYTMSRPLSKSNCELLGLDVNEVTANMRVCSKCRFRSLRKSPCPVTTCKKARRKAKRLKPLPTKWLEISEDQRRIISEELGISSEVNKCCPACFHRITRRLSNENEPDLTSIAGDAENEEDLVETPDWTKKEISALKHALRKHGKNWSEVSKVICSKQEGQCKDLYDTYRQKHHLEQIVADYERAKKKREHRVSVAESLGSTITAPSDNEGPSSDGENDADESSDTDSASENEYGGPLRNKWKGLGAESEKGEDKGGSTTKSDEGTLKELVGVNEDSPGEIAKPADNMNINDSSSVGEARVNDTVGSNNFREAEGNATSVAGENDRESTMVDGAKTGEILKNDEGTKELEAQGKPSSELPNIEGTRGLPGSKPAPPGNGIGPAKEAQRSNSDMPVAVAGDKMEVDSIRTDSKPEDDGGDTSATCSADEGNSMDVDVAFSGSSKSGSLPQKPARSRVSSSEDDTKLSELKAKLEVARSDGPGSGDEGPMDPKLTKEGVSSEVAKKGLDQQERKLQQQAEEAKSWGSHGILNMRDLIDSAIYKHLGQEEVKPEVQPPAAKSQEPKPVTTTEASQTVSTQSIEMPPMTKSVVTSPVAMTGGRQTPSKAPPRRTPTPDRSEVRLIEPSPPQPPMRASHITHTSLQDRDIYEVSGTHRPGSGHRSPGHRSPGKRLTSPAGYMDPLQSRLLEGAHGANQGLIGTVPHPGGIMPRGASPRGASPHASERDHQLNSPSGRHNYSPRSSATASPYALIPASDRHHPSPAGQARSLPRSKQTSVPPPPPLVNKLSPMVVKQEKHSPSGGVHGLAYAGSISQGTPGGYMPRPDMAAVRFDGPGAHMAQNERLMMLARARSPATSSPQYIGGSITQGTPLSRREPHGRPHERLMENESAHSKEPLHQKPPRVKVEQPMGPEKGGWGMQMVSPYDGALLPAEILKSLNDREVALQMAADPAMLYMYTQRHLMQYGGEYGPGLVRGQYASEAYNSSKATLADDFATAQRMTQRMPLPTTSAAPNNPRQSPRQEAAVSSAQRGSPAGHHQPRPMEALPPGIPFAPFLPHQQGGYIMVAPHQYMQGMTVATGPHQLPHLFTTMAPTHPSPRSPHTQGASHPLHQDLKNHSPTVRAAPSPSDAKPRLWQQGPAGAGGHFRAPARGPSPALTAAVLMGQSPHHPFGLPVQRATIPGGSIMQGTPMWKQQTTAASITSGTPNPELRDSRKPDRGPSPLPPRSQGPSSVRRSEAQRIADYNMARKEHPAGIQHENEDVRRPPHQSSAMHHESHPHHHQQSHQQSHQQLHQQSHQQQHPKRPPSTSHTREQQQLPPQAHQERRPPTREGEISHPSQPAHYPHERRLKTEKIEMEGGKGKANNATDLLATMFEKDTVRPGGTNVKAEQGGAGKTGFTAASLIDHIIHQSINRPSEEEVQVEMKNSAVTMATAPSTQPPPRTSSQSGHQPPPTSVSQNTGRMASNLIDQLIVQQIKHEMPEEEKLAPRPSSQGNPHQKGGNRETNALNYDRGSGGGHKSNHIDSTVSSIPQGQYRPVPILAPHSRISIGDHINAIVTKGYSQSLQKASNMETVDSTTAHRGVERTIVRGENDMSYSKNPRVANDVHSKGSRTVSPAIESSRAADSSTIMNYAKRPKPSTDNKDFHEDSARGVQHSVTSSMMEPREAVGSQVRAPSRDSVRTMDPTQLPGGYQGRFPHGERDFRGQIPRTEGTLSRTPGGHRLPPGVSPMGHLPPHSAVKQQQQVSSNAIVNYSREGGITSGRPTNFQESINRMIERQVRANDPMEEAQLQGRWPVSRSYEPVRPGPDSYKRNLTIAQLQGQPNGPPKANSRAELVANKENSVHSTPIASSAPGGHATLPPAGMPTSSHPGMVPAGYAYPVLTFMPNHQPTSHAIHHGSSPSLLATVPRASPTQAPGGPRRENNPHHAPLLSSEYECLSDDE